MRSLRLSGLSSARLPGVSLPGAWEDFVWASGEAEEAAAGGRLRLLAVTEARALLLYEAASESGRWDATLLRGVPEERLRALAASRDADLLSISSLQVLSFKNSRAILLLNNFMIVHLIFPGGELGEEVEGCFRLDLPPQTLERTVNVTFCRGIIFLLDETGWIHIFGAIDGAYLAHISVSLYQSRGQEEGNQDMPFPLVQLSISYDLSMAVVVSRSSCVAAVDLNLYFREYPDHLFCKQQSFEGLDEDDLSSSGFSMKSLQPLFQTDRSRKTHVLPLNDIHSHNYSPHLDTDVELPWYQHLLPLEPLNSKTWDTSAASLFQEVAFVLSSSRGKDTKSTKDRRWKNIHLSDPEEPGNLDCKQVTGFHVLFTVSSESEGLTLVLWDLVTQDITQSCVGKNSFFVEYTREEPLWLVLSETGLSLFLFGFTQEEFLNRLIIYGSASTVDSLCRLNGWGRCSIPVHALEAGLENRQLDTVDFFLKNKENIFSLSEASSVQDQPVNNMSDFYLKSVEELRPALDLLCKAIQENDVETQSKHFSEQLLNLTLSFLNKQLREIFTHREEVDENMVQCIDILTSYITKLRTLMIRFPHKPFGVVSQPWDSEDNLPQMDQRHWEAFDTEQAVTEALLSNRVPEAQTFFRLTHNPAQDLGQLTRIGLEMAYKSLLKNDISEASRLLRNMGLSVKQQLHKICFYTTDYHVRDFLVSALQEEDVLPETEKEMIDFVHEVENIYSGTFQRKEKNAACCRSWRKEPDGINVAALDSFLSCTQDRIHNREHRVMLNWAEWWSPSTRERVLLLVRAQEGEFRFCNPEALWMYLSSWHDWVNISSWISESRPEGSPANWPPLPLGAIGRRTLCSHYLRNEVLDILARNGTFVPAELEDFEGLLQRVACTGGLMQEPHPLLGYVSAGGLELHACFILYCLERGLDHILYSYLDYYRLFSSACPILNDKELREAHPWFEFLVQCRDIANNPGDADMIFQASLANAQILIPSNQASVSTMLLEGRTLLALATTMFARGGIDQIVQKGDGREKVDAQLFRMALAPYPKLRAALFPQITPHGIPPPDLSLYHLVQCLAPFDSTKLFGWQSANTLAIPDICSDLPHFSCSALVNKHAIIENLDFSYYLHHERPSFAFGAFLTQQLSKSDLPKELVQQVAKEAYALALSVFYVPPLAATSVCFLEMLGLQSLKLRVDAKAANVILSFMSRREEPQHHSIRQSLVEKLGELADGERTAAEDLLVCLEEAVWEKVDHQEINKTSGEARRHWSLVIQFCQLHHIKLSTSYLRACARSNEWLQFVTEAQMHGYQPAEVIPLLRDFPLPLREHLELALGHLQPPKEGDLQALEQKPQDLFHVLLQSQEQPCPWRHLLAASVKHQAPVLSVLAACSQDASILHCLCVWIITSMDRSATREVIGHIEGKVETHEWSLADLALLWHWLLERGKARTLLHGFQLFLKDSPLLIMLEVYELCMDYKSYSQAKIKLLTFQDSLSKLQAECERGLPVLPGPWLEMQASFLLELMLHQCRTEYEFRKLLELLADAGTALLQGPDLKKLSALSAILKDSPISVSRTLLSNYSLERFQEECQRILEQLQESSSFSVARNVAELAALPVDNVVIQEVLQNILLLKQIGHWTQKRTRVGFWKKCHENYVQNAVSNRAASSFFAAQVDLVSEGPEDQRGSGISERQLLLTLAGHWLARSDPIPVDDLEKIEKEIWRCHITRQTFSQGTGQMEPRGSHQVSISSELSFDSLAKEFSFSKVAALSTPKYLELRGFPSQDTSTVMLSKAEVGSLSFLIGRLLDEGSVHEAARLCRYFSFYNRDVALILHCRRLALGEAAQRCFHPEIQALLAAESSKRHRGEAAAEKKRLKSSSSLDSWPSVEGSSPDSGVVGSLQTLVAECVHGRNYCRQTLYLYELSKELGCSFSEIAVHDSEKLLRAILSSQQPDWYKKAQAFITNQGLEPGAVAELVAEEITRELLVPSQGRGTLNPAEESQRFLQLAKLCQDHTLVGMKLLDKVSSVPHGELACTVELLILAHNCFSLTCHMEGITRVLQAARLLTDEHLAPNEEYGLVVRLLTGIGRYNEMTYIFDLLHEKHYFEVLMRKKLDPNGTLKTALLDYIKRCRPGDSEKHNMIALCFSMCREIGENHEAAANVQLKLIESQPWEESLLDVPSLKKLLMKALTLFLDAAESYSKDFCVCQSLRCRKLARLITLQLHFLTTPHKTQLINLRRGSLLPCVLALPRFYQAAVVAEAYDFTPDWSEVLHQQVILKGDFSYLEEYKQQGLLKAGTFEEVAQKFKQQAASESAVRNLKKLLTYCEDIYVYYKLAYDNQFYDVVNMLLNDAQTGCCLNDLLAN
ncbi:spatacsin [Protobothrops mucrosquamatus]|uniref:spatacsin n=1 Tax=Protobothrops mucrosquamatus TaxID=103944 RepID=UPI0010FAE8D1|nr:spatacsin [Protobothrops mucrosquamatus]